MVAKRVPSSIFVTALVVFAVVIVIILFYHIVAI